MNYRFLPNLMTLGNLFCGCLAVISIFQPNFFGSYTRLTLVTFFVLIGLLLDFFDGFVARALGVSSELGKQLDSLADSVTFGLVPAVLLFYELQQLLPNFKYLAIIPLIISLAAVYRLGRFNLLEDTSSYFIGLATPAATLLSIGFIYVLRETNLPYQTILIIGFTVIVSYLMNSNLPLFSFKLKSKKLSHNWYRVLLLVIAVILFIAFQWSSLFYSILIYILLSILVRKQFT